MQEFNLIIVAAGTGTRTDHDTPKQYIDFGGKTLLRHTLDAFSGIEGLKETVIVIHADHGELYTEDIPHCTGGDTRQQSVANGLKYFAHLRDDDLILIHDAARPFVTQAEIVELLDAMQTHQAATLATPVSDTLRYDNGAHVSRDNLFALQTPQAFHYGVLKKAHAQHSDKAHTDDTSLVSELGIDIKYVAGSPRNFKITTAEDIELAKIIMSSNTKTHIGSGFDVHAFDEETKGVETVRLCGVDIPHNKKLKGHSDADVGLHALTDAILGAIGEGDIGLHYPPSNDDFKDMDSAIFLKRAMTMLNDKGATLINADVTLICENPKIGKHREEIVSRLSDLLGLNPAHVNIKATTTEKLGFTGREEGIAAQAIVSVERPIKGTAS